MSSKLTNVEVLVVAGGGAGGQDIAGGGGGGGIIYDRTYLLPGDIVDVTVGAGGSVPTNSSNQGTSTVPAIDPPVYYDIPGEYSVRMIPGLYTVKIWGAGGGGSRGENNSSSRGGGGACIVKTNINVERVEDWTVWVGNGGLSRIQQETELGGDGYGTGGNGALEFSAMNPDYKIATYNSNTNRLSAFLQTREPVLVLLRNAEYHGSLTGKSLFIEEDYKYSNSKFFASTEPVNALIDQNINTIYFSKNNTNYRFSQFGNTIIIFNIRNEVIARVAVAPDFLNLIFSNGYIQISLPPNFAAVGIKVSNGIDDSQTIYLKNNDVPISIGFVNNNIISTSYKLSGYAGGGGGGSSAIKGTSIDQTGLLVAGGGGGAGGNRSTLNLAGGGGFGNGYAGRAGPDGIDGVGTNDEVTIGVVGLVNSSAHYQWLKDHGIWELVNGSATGDYFNKTYSVNFTSTGDYKVKLGTQHLASVYIDGQLILNVNQSSNVVENTIRVNQGIRKIRLVSETTSLSCYTLDDFVREYRGNNTADDFKSRANKIITLYKSISTEFTLSDNTKRYGLGRLPDVSGLQKWVTESYQNNWNLESAAFYSVFFLAADVDSNDSTRSKTSLKSYNNFSSTGCTDFRDAAKKSLGTIPPAVGCMISSVSDASIIQFDTKNLPTQSMRFGGGAGGGSSSSRGGAGGGAGGRCQQGTGRLFIGDNGKSNSSEQALAGNSADDHYRGIAGRGGDSSGRSGNGLVVIINTSKTGLQISNGQNSRFGALIAIGGGGGSGSASLNNGGTGGSGGGTNSGRLAGLGTISQGFNGAVGIAKCYDIDNFVSEFKDNYDRLAFKNRALNIQDVYTTNSSYVLTNGDTRYGLFRKADVVGLAYWTKICLDQNWTIASKNFLDSFFGTIANNSDTAEAARALTNTKPYNPGSNSCTFIDRGNIDIGGGGGGAAQAGFSNGTGGNGLRSEITGIARYYGGGGGGTDSTNYPYPGGLGGGGTNHGFRAAENNGTANTGGGGSAFSGSWGGAGNGGSGIVIIKYPSPIRAKGGIITEDNNIVLHQFVRIGEHKFELNLQNPGISPPDPLEENEISCTGDLALSEYYAGQGIVRLGTVGFPDNVNTLIPSRSVISIKNFYGAKTGEYSIIGLRPDNPQANLVLWEQNTQGLFRVTSVHETEKLYYSIESIILPTVFDPKIYPANTIPGQYTNYVNTNFNITIIGGPYLERVRVEKMGPGLAGNQTDEYKLDPEGNFVAPDAQFYNVGVYTYTFYFPNTYSYANGNILIWTGNFTPAPPIGVSTTTQPPILVPIPSTTTTTSTTQPPYSITINTFPFVGNTISQCGVATVGVRNGPPGAGMSLVITGPENSLTNGTGRQEFTNLHLGTGGAYTFEPRQFLLPGRYEYVFNFSTPTGTSIIGGNRKTFNITVNQGKNLRVVSANRSTTFAPGELVRVIVEGEANDVVTYSGPTSSNGGINLGPDGREEITLLRQGEVLSAQDYTWTFTTDFTKTCNTETFRLTIITTSTTTRRPDDDLVNDPGCSTQRFKQPGSFIEVGLGPKGMLVYEENGNPGTNGRFVTFNASDIGTLRGTRLPKLLASKVIGNNTDGYAEISHWGAAAVHAGIVRDGELALIKIQSVGRKQHFIGTSANNINSVTQNNTSLCAYKLSKESGAPRNNVCPTTYSGIMLQGFNTPFNSSNIAEITASNSIANGAVYGNNSFGYSWKSNFQLAVIHAGLLQDGNTGNIRIIPMGNKYGFPSTTNNGVTSTGYDGDSCAVRLENPFANQGPPNAQCSPINFVDCCPLIYDTTTTLVNVTVNGLQAVITNGNTTVTGRNSPSDPNNLVWGDNTNGYAWGSDISMAVVHAGILGNGQTGNIRIINNGIKNNFGSSLGGGITSVASNSQRCSFKLEKNQPQQITPPPSGGGGVNCSPVDWITCCPAVYNNTLNAKYYVSDNLVLGANGKVTVIGTIRSSDRPTFAHHYGDNDNGYLWGPKNLLSGSGNTSGPWLDFIVTHAGFAIDKEKVTVRLINIGTRNNFPGVRGKNPYRYPDPDPRKDDGGSLIQSWRFAPGSGGAPGDWAGTGLNGACAFKIQAIDPSDSDYNSDTDTDYPVGTPGRTTPLDNRGTTTTTQPPFTSSTTTLQRIKIVRFILSNDGYLQYTISGPVTKVEIMIVWSNYNGAGQAQGKAWQGSDGYWWDSKNPNYLGKDVLISCPRRLAGSDFNTFAPSARYRFQLRIEQELPNGQVVQQERTRTDYADTAWNYGVARPDGSFAPLSVTWTQNPGY